MAALPGGRHGPSPRLPGHASVVPCSRHLVRRLEERAAHERPLLGFSPEPAGLVAGIHDETLATIERDGFAVLPSLLPPATCDDIERCARQAACTLMGSTDPSPGPATFDPAAPRARRYEIPEADLLACPPVQELLADESILRLAQDYLGAAPVQDLVAGWWSAPGEGTASGASISTSTGRGSSKSSST